MKSNKFLLYGGFIYLCVLAVLWLVKNGKFRLVAMLLLLSKWTLVLFLEILGISLIENLIWRFVAAVLLALVMSFALRVIYKINQALKEDEKEQSIPKTKVNCFNCQGGGCPVCSGSGYL